MGMFKSYFKWMARPWTEGAGAVKRIGGVIKQVGMLISYYVIDIKTKKEQANSEPDIDPKKRFNELYEKNDWNEQRLERQLRASVRIKRISVFLAWVIFCVMCAAPFVLQFWTVLIVELLTSVMLFLFLARTMQMTIFQIQLESRSLIGLNDYIKVNGRPAFIKKILS